MRIREFLSRNREISHATAKPLTDVNSFGIERVVVTAVAAAASLPVLSTVLWITPVTVRGHVGRRPRRAAVTSRPSPARTESTQ